MTVEEAQGVFNRLCVVFRYKDASEGEIEVWLEHLRSVPYDLADKAVWEISRSPRFRFMPRIGEFLGFVDEMHSQGVPNALGVVGPAARPVDEYNIWRMDKIVALPDSDYWQFCFDDQVRGQFEKQWADEWARSRTDVA